MPRYPLIMTCMLAGSYSHFYGSNLMFYVKLDRCLLPPPCNAGQLHTRFGLQ